MQYMGCIPRSCYMQYMPCASHGLHALQCMYVAPETATWITMHVASHGLHGLQGMCRSPINCYMDYKACSKSWASGFRRPQMFRGWRLQQRCLAGSPSKYVFLRFRYENGPSGDLNASLYVESRCGSPGDSGLVRKGHM